MCHCSTSSWTASRYLLQGLHSELLGNHVFPAILRQSSSSSWGLLQLIELLGSVDRSMLQQHVLPALRHTEASSLHWTESHLGDSAGEDAGGVPAERMYDIRLWEYQHLSPGILRKHLGDILRTLHGTRRRHDPLVLRLALRQCLYCQATSGAHCQGRCAWSDGRWTCGVFYQRVCAVVADLCKAGDILVAPELFLEGVDLGTSVGRSVMAAASAVVYLGEEEPHLAEEGLTTEVVPLPLEPAPKWCHRPCNLRIEDLTLRRTGSVDPKSVCTPATASLLLRNLVLLHHFRKVHIGSVHYMGATGSLQPRLSSRLVLHALQHSDVEELVLCDPDWKRGMNDVLCASESLEAARCLMRMPRLRKLTVDVRCTSRCQIREEGLSYFLHLLAAVTRYSPSAAAGHGRGLHALEELVLHVPQYVNLCSNTSWSYHWFETGPMWYLSTTDVWRATAEALSHRYMPQLRRVVVHCSLDSPDASCKAMFLLKDLARVRAQDMQGEAGEAARLDSVLLTHTSFVSHDLLQGNNPEGLRQELQRVTGKGGFHIRHPEQPIRMFMSQIDGWT